MRFSLRKKVRLFVSENAELKLSEKEVSELKTSIGEAFVSNSLQKNYRHPRIKKISSNLKRRMKTHP